MNQMQAQVKRFHISASYMAPSHPINFCSFRGPITMPTGESIAFKEYLLRRHSWLQEECDELKEAIETDNEIDIIDALVDALYFIFGTAVSIGIDIEPFFNEIHKTNLEKIPACCTCDGTGVVHRKLHDGIIRKVMCTKCSGRKISPIYRMSDGKLIKPENWKPPDLIAILLAQRDK